MNILNNLQAWQGRHFLDNLCFRDLDLARRLGAIVCR